MSIVCIEISLLFLSAFICVDIYEFVIALSLVECKACFIQWSVIGDHQPHVRACPCPGVVGQYETDSIAFASSFILLW